MFEIRGKYTSAKIFTDNIDQESISQIYNICNMEIFKDQKIRIMPDCHAGAGCVVGFTSTFDNYIIPNLVGVDIGCGMEVAVIKEKNIDLEKLDKIIHNFIPSDFDIREEEHSYAAKIDLSALKCYKHIDADRAYKSIGTLGGGNHFIEVDKDTEGNLYLVIHSGSRYLGKQVCEFYQELAYKRLTDVSEKVKEIIERLKKEGRQKEIQKEIEKIKNQRPHINKEVAYLTEQNLQDYLHDMKITQYFAVLNRKAIVDEIIKQMRLTVVEQFTTIHNYVDIDKKIIRKGSISAQKDEKVIIPINMRDGSIIAVGKGNPDWNYSAPHGAGRIMSRREAKENISLEDFKQAMQGIYSTTVNEHTIDESPFVYKTLDEIVENTKDTIEIVNIIKPIYNYKHASQSE